MSQYFSFDEIARRWADDDASISAERRLARMARAFWEGDFERPDGSSVVFFRDVPAGHGTDIEGRFRPGFEDEPNAEWRRIDGRPIPPPRKLSRKQERREEPDRGETRVALLRWLRDFGAIVLEDGETDADVIGYLADGWLRGDPYGGEIERELMRRLCIERADFIAWCGRSKLAALAFWSEGVPDGAVSSSRRQRRRKVENDARLRNRIESVLAAAAKILQNTTPPSLDALAEELVNRKGKDGKLHGYGVHTIKRILIGNYNPMERRGIEGLKWSRSPDTVSKLSGNI